MRITKTLSIAILTLLIAGCSLFSDYWILEEERLSEVPEVRTYTERLQQDEYLDSATFSIFTISEERKMVVIFSGDKTKAFEFSHKKNTKKDQEIIVKEIDNETNHNNPFLLVGLDKIEGDLQVYNETTKEYIINADEN